MTVRLCLVAVENWEDLDGWAVSRNMPPLESLPLERFGSLVWHWMSRNGEQKDIDRMRARLWQPPKGTEARVGPWSPEAETSAFKSLQAAVGQGKTAR